MHGSPMRKVIDIAAAGSARLLPAPPGPGASECQELPRDIFRYVLKTSGGHQVVLVLLSITVFLIEVVPLELQRRIVNDVVKHRNYRLVIGLCAVYAAIVLVHGGTKLVLNVYRSWVGERATRDLRRRVRNLLATPSAAARIPDASGVEVSMIVAEVEPIGGFVGVSVSEPLLQGGVLLSVLAYMIHLEAGMAAATLVIFLPQLVFIPLLQRAINRRTKARVWILRQLSAVVIMVHEDEASARGAGKQIDRVFEFNMGIFRLKFTMNFLMNVCHHLQIIAVLLVGGWYVLTGQLEIGGVVAFLSAIGRLNDPWGDLINYFRDVTNTQVKFQLVADAIKRLSLGQAPLDVATS